jgi:hypothetical protein
VRVHYVVVSFTLLPHYLMKPIGQKVEWALETIQTQRWYRGKFLHPKKVKNPVTKTVYSYFTNRSISSWDGYLTHYSDWLRAGRPGFDPRRRQRIFPLPSATRPAVGPTQTPVQWVPGFLSLGAKGGRGVMLTTHALLLPRSRKSGSYTSSPPKRLHGV